MSKKTRIDFYKSMVCPVKVRNGFIPFNDWCTNNIPPIEYLEIRSFLILDFYTAFKKLYEYIINGFSPKDINDLYCDFDNDNMIITIKFCKKICIDNDFINNLKTVFNPTITDDYKKIFIIYNEKIKKGIIKISFIRKCDSYENKTS